MIPYFRPPALALGPFTLETFGLLAALGILLGSRLLVRQAAREGLSPQPLQDMVPWALVGGLLGGHWVHLFLYHPEELARGPLQIFKLWDGLSSFGGLLGGLLATLLFFRTRRLALRPYADALALGVAPGWAVARVGCFLIHDHPGALTSFPLAVAFPGGARHDLGLYDALLLGALSALLYLLHRRGLLRARLLPLLALLYAPARFALDFLRATDLPYVDARYLGLTPAQYGCLALLAFAAWGLARWRPLLPCAQAPRLSPQPHASREPA